MGKSAHEAEGYYCKRGRSKSSQLSWNNARRERGAFSRWTEFAPAKVVVSRDRQFHRGNDPRAASVDEFRGAYHYAVNNTLPSSNWALQSLLHAVIETNPDALTIASTLDAERQSGQLRGPGIPILVKDKLATADQMHNSGIPCARRQQRSGITLERESRSFNDLAAHCYESDLSKVIEDSEAALWGLSAVSH